MEIIESFQKAKSASRLCEDALVVNDNFVAVIDGATPKGKLKWNGKTSGRMAAEVLSKAVNNLRGDAKLEDFIAETNGKIRKVYIDYGRDGIVREQPCERLSASVVVFSVMRNEVWMIGDCRFLVNGVGYDNPKCIDACLARARADVNQYLLRKGYSIDSLRANDIGRAMISDLLCEQQYFQNSLYGECFGYCVVDGFDLPRVSHLPKSMCTLCVPVAAGCEIVMATDGYPVLYRTLEESEKYLAQCLADDPLCIFSNVQTKGMAADADSYDDRAYVRFRT